MRWPMHATRAQTHRQRASHVIAALQFIATTFVMHVMVGCSSGQIKMPRPDAYLHSVARRFYQLNSIFRSDYNPFLGQKEPVGAIHIDNKSFPNFDRFVPHCNVCAHSMKRLVALSSSKAFPLLISANFQHTPDRLTP